MRGGPLSSPEIVQLLQPFIVTTWNGAGPSAMGPDIKEIYTQSNRPKGSNPYVFVLDQWGRLVHDFRGLPGRRGNDRSDYKVEITKAIERLNLPSTRAPRTTSGRPDAIPDLKASVPGVPAGVRLFLRSNDDRHPFRIGPPVVEVVPMTPEEWRILSLPEGNAGRRIDPETLRNWLVHLYPAAIRTVDQSKPFRKMTGLLKLEPAGSSGESRYGLLQGAILLTKGEGPAADAESAFEGTLRAVLTYPRGGSDVQSLRGVIDGFYIYRVRGDSRPVPLRIAIESRPE